MEKLCPALWNHCLLGHSPWLFLQPAGDNQLKPRQSEDHIHRLDQNKTLNMLVISMASVESCQFSTLSVSLLLWESSDPPPIQPSRILWHWFCALHFYSGIRSMPHRQMMKGSLIQLYAEITFWVGHNWGQLLRQWIRWQHTEGSACWMWQWSFSGYGPRSWTAMYGNTVTRTLTKAMDIVPETI